ncbi:methionine ABC transporter ATP-binding protein [Sphaerobacter thermophilus]|uniref:Cell division ATP-binding protein FtsE n=1 Tax=Sphaerobacter thermophilus (strain ATCC 49802 / DSM 20745 / KCCM 41009 / NCIMB 13125 / S 6022) TaxID=479434 RepID=D1C3T7_SPHTD|nr:ATP-binding cassette domain-containing protein [Sphaerobacter thermophilus]ACZ38904.1 ABC transporter related protein [Sphaerobacter thermophilus DSM 20745]
MIEIENLRKEYRQRDRTVVALDGVSLTVRPGEIFGVVGQSGAGKSTLIRCVNLLERPTSGVVRVNGQDMTRLRGAELRRARQRIGMIFQHFNLLSSRTVAENVALPLEVMGYPRRERQRRVAELLALVGLEDRADAYPAQLSGGQKQRVGIARALAAEPAVLLSDEATSALDPETTQSILALLRDLNQRLGLTILLITHEMGVVKEICHRVAVLEAGRIVESGTVAELASRPGSHLATTLFPRPALNGNRPDGLLATLTFVGAAADAPVMTTLVRQFSVDVNVLSGSIELVQGERIGQLQVALSGDRIDEALEWLRGQGLGVEVH